MSKIKTLRATDTGSVLTYDADKNIITDTSKTTHLWDAFGRQYKKCNNCKKWYLLESFPTSDSKLSKDGRGPLCPRCMKKKNIKETMLQTCIATVDNTKGSGGTATSTTSVENNNAPESDCIESITPIRQLPDEIIIQEMRRRGYKGSINVIKEYNL